MTKHQAFFKTEVPTVLEALKPTTPRKWGTMSATKMLDHLLAGTLLMLSKREVLLGVDAEKLPRLKAFLMSDKPFAEGAPKPELYTEYETAAPEDFEGTKAAFLHALKNFDYVTSTESDFWSFHPTFGKLTAEETRQLQYKHIRHHFQQFGLM